MDFEDRYRIVRRIADGGMGTVHEAYDEKLGKTVAIKILNGQQLNPKQMKRLRVEAQALGAVSHPNIVNVLAYQTLDDGVPFLVMDFIDGDTLEAKAPLDDATFRHIFLQIADALAHAHGHGIVHRDLKPSNIMVTADGDAKILDFGVSKILGVEDQRLTKTGEVIGTPHYISPEQCTNGSVDTRSDIYLLGLCMFFALTGRNPYSAESTMELVMKQASEPLDCSVLPEAYRGLVERCTQKSPESRFQSASEVALILKGEASVPHLVAQHPQPHPARSVKLQLLVAGAVFLTIPVVIYGLQGLKHSDTAYDPEAATRNVQRVESIDYGADKKTAEPARRAAVSKAVTTEISRIDEKKYPLEAAYLYNMKARYTRQIEDRVGIAKDFQHSVELAESVLTDPQSSLFHRQKASQYRADGEVLSLPLIPGDQFPLPEQRVNDILQHCKEAVRNSVRADTKHTWIFAMHQLAEDAKANFSPPAAAQLGKLDAEIAAMCSQDAVLNEAYFTHANPMHLGPDIHKPLKLGE